MTIKAQQRVLLVIIGTIFIVMIGIVIQSNRVGEYYQTRGVRLTQIIKEVFDFNIAAGDYILNHHERALNQMELRINSLSKPLSAIKFARADRQGVLVEMQKELEHAHHIFQRLKESHTSFTAKYGPEISEKTDAFGHQEIQDLSRSLTICAMSLVTSAQFLTKSSIEKQAEVIAFYDRLLMACMALSFTILFISVLVFSRRFVRSINNLKDGAAQIAGGDLGARIKLTGNDELTNLTRSINEMSEKLQKSYELLEDEIEERKRTEESLLESEKQLLLNEENINNLNMELEKQLVKLQESNREMESFTYSVSHDLRAPLRHITGFVQLLLETDTSGLDDTSKHYLTVIADSAKKMSCLIDDLLSFSRMGRGEMAKSSVNLQQITKEVIEDISRDIPPGRQIEWHMENLPTVTGDRAMLRLVLFNLISNAVKYSNKVEKPFIEIGTLPSDDSHILFVKDNGAGFNMKYVDKLFGLFQRLHSSEEYEGTGVGLANVRRIIGRHGGRTWAEGEINRGATFYFTLPFVKEKNHE